VLLRHCFSPALSSPSSPAASEAATLLPAESAANALPDARPEWPIVTMLLGLFQFDALALLYHWLQAVGVRPSKFPARIQQDFPEIFLACARPGSLRVLLFFCMLVQGALPPLQALHTSHPAGASSLVD
jgi:hypothetical protein